MTIFMETVVEFVSNHWTGAVEIVLLSVLLYYGYLYFRGTPGAKILVGLALIFISLTLASQLLDLHVIGPRFAGLRGLSEVGISRHVRHAPVCR